MSVQFDGIVLGKSDGMPRKGDLKSFGRVLMSTVEVEAILSLRCYKPSVGVDFIQVVAVMTLLLQIILGKVCRREPRRGFMDINSDKQSQKL